MRNRVDEGGVGRHETFTPRYGWLKKGYDRAKQDPFVFNAPDAIERLGVGKNMVRSIRFWCLAFHLLEYETGHERKGQRGALKPTSLGDRLLSDEGWDPYLEDVASLWLLHWQLFVPPFQAASWPVAFNHVLLPLFDLRQLTRAILAAAKRYEKLAALSDSSYEKDASCLIRMYSPATENSLFEIESPFCQLGIVRAAEEPNTYRFDMSEKHTLPNLVFTAACIDYSRRTQSAQRSLSLHKTIYEYNSPGIAFKLSETEAGRLLGEASERTHYLEFVESMGYSQLQFSDNPENLFWKLLDDYYNSPKS